mgnify:CR=1 FL=1
MYGVPALKLLDKSRQYLWPAVPVCNPQAEMVSSNEAAIPDKKHLYHRIMLIYRHGNDIFILHVTAGNLLFLSNLGHTV